MSLIGGANAIGWAQFQLRGGWKNILATTAGYAVLVGGGILLMERLNASAPRAVLSACTNGLLGLQLLILVLFAVTRVSTSIRADLNSRMIESHRMMPVSAGEVVFGYIFGSTSQAMALGVANVLIGLITCAAASLPLDGWIAANAVLFFFAVFLWAISALGGFLFQATWALMRLGGVAFWISQGRIFALAPAVMVLTSPLIGKTIFSTRPLGSYISTAYALAVLSQLAIGGVCFVAAGRKYRDPDGPAFGAVPGLMLLAAWVGVSAVGLGFWEEIDPRSLWLEGIDHPTQLLGALISAMPIALTALAAGAKQDVERRRRLATGLDAPAPRGPSMLLTALAATILMMYVVVALPKRLPQFRVQCAWTAAVLLLFMVGADYAMRIFFRLRLRPAFFVGGWLLLALVGPFIADGVRYSMTDGTGNGLSTLSTFSPAGALVCIWTPPATPNPPINIAAGVIGQLLLTLLLALLYYRIAPGARRTAPP